MQFETPDQHFSLKPINGCNTAQKKSPENGRIKRECPTTEYKFWNQTENFHRVIKNKQSTHRRRKSWVVATLQ